MQNQYKILQPQKYLKTNFPDGISLPNCYLSSTEISLLEDSIEETIQQEEWLNAQVIILVYMNFIVVFNYFLASITITSYR